MIKLSLENVSGTKEEYEKKLMDKYSVDYIKSADLDSCEVEDLRDMLRYMKRMRAEMKSVTDKVRGVYEHKVAYDRVIKDFDKLSPAKKKIYKDLLANK